PIRLGIQHLQRVRGKGQSTSFEATLKETSERILAEIDRLDGIARAFSRFGAPPPSAAELLPLEPVDLAATAREVVQLYDLGSATRFEVRASNGAPPPALARKDEVKEVLVNLLENARNADAKRVTVHVAASGRQLVVSDDGRGIPPEVLPRVFEPTFSTTSSGAGLGLAIAQFSFDARRYGMGGVSLSRDGNARSYNPAYRAVKNRNHVAGAPKFSIPVPIGLIDFFKKHPINQLGHDPMFSPESAAFNPAALLNVIFNPPIFYDVKKAPTPTNDVQVKIARDSLIVDLGATKVLIPEQDFGLGTTSRLLDAGVGFAGFHVGVMGFLQYDVKFTLDSTLRNFLTNDSTARPNTNYFVNTDGTAQAGFAPT